MMKTPLFHHDFPVDQRAIRGNFCQARQKRGMQLRVRRFFEEMQRAGREPAGNQLVVFTETI
jgi:hypothetical protein